MKPGAVKFCLVVACVLTLAGGSALWGDPPSRVGRLSSLSGTVSFRPEGVEDWVPATLNYPLTIGDGLWTDQDGGADIHVGSTAIHLASSTAISFLNLDDQTIQIRLSTGSLNLRLRQVGAAEQFEVDSPNASLSILRAGTYRIDVQQNGDTTAIVRSGEIEATAGDSVFPLSVRQMASITGVDSPAYQVTRAPPLDEWDLACQARDQREDNVASAQYVPRDLDGVEDLDQYGSWRVDPDLGPVWAPVVTVVGWAPYRFGHWAWIDPWGWTWIDDAPWGFAPFHYGRWAFSAGAWVWVPGAHLSRAVYAPALVTFVGGAGWHPHQAPGESVGWFPLGPHEPYVPPYRSDRTRLHNVDLEHITYVNRSVPGAVTVVPGEAFIHGQPAERARLTLPSDDLGRAPVRGAVAPLVPQKESLFGGASVSRAKVAQPPAFVTSRPVVARLTPPPQPVPFAARRQALAAHPGQPLDAGRLSNLSRSAPPSRPPVSAVTPGRGVGQPVASVQAQTGMNRSAVLVPRQPAAIATGRAGTVVQPSVRRAATPSTGSAGTVALPSVRKPAAPPAGRTATVVQSPVRRPVAPAAGERRTASLPRKGDKLPKQPGD